jgi:hypothetical protein
MSLVEFQFLVQRLVRAPAELVTPDDVDRVLGSAVRQYSQDRPRTLVRDVTWLAAGYYGPVPAELGADSLVLEAEQPIGEVPRRLRQVALAINPPEVLQLVCEDSLAAGAVLRLQFTAVHQLDAGVDTIPSEDRDAVGSWAAHLLCRELATHFSGERESSIGADGSNTDSRARNYSMRAKEYRAAYFGALGMADPGAGSSGSGSGAAAPAGAAAVAAWPARKRPWFTVGV